MRAHPQDETRREYLAKLQPASSKLFQSAIWQEIQEEKRILENNPPAVSKP